MHLPPEDLTLIQRYYLDTINWDRELKDIASEPYHEQIWTWWQALAHFRLRRHYERLEDAPDGIEWITVMGEESKGYAWREGKYVHVQTATKGECRKFFG